MPMLGFLMNTGHDLSVSQQFEEAEQNRLDKLSPGLLYLEQVCRMLENIAKLQQQNHNLQKEVENLKSQHDETEVSDIDI